MADQLPQFNTSTEKSAESAIHLESQLTAVSISVELKSSDPNLTSTLGGKPTGKTADLETEETGETAAEETMPRTLETQENSEKSEPLEPISINICRGTSLVVPAKCGKFEIDAVVDTAAQATLISESLFSKLSHMYPKAKQGKTMSLKGLGDQPVEAQAIPGFKFRLGDKYFQWTVLVAPMTDEMILGLDFLKYHHANMDLAGNKVSIEGVDLNAFLKKTATGETMKVSRVVVAKKTVIPPHTLAHVPVKWRGEPGQTWCVEPQGQSGDVALAATITDNTETLIRFANLADTYVTLRKGHFVGVASEAEVLESPEEHPAADVRTVITSTEPGLAEAGPSGTTANSNVDIQGSGQAEAGPNPKTDSGQAEAGPDDDSTFSKTAEETPENIANKLKSTLEQLPAKLTELYERSRQELNDSEALQLLELLIEYEDTFAGHDLDLGCFPQVQHKINTGTSPPFKQKMRRTPLGFEEEEEKHLQKMLDVGVIEPSCAEWASPPVLIRKRDGTVRYCVDFRRLNSITIKDAFPLPLIEDCLDSLAGSVYFSTLDMASGYYQIEIAPEDREKTAFITKYGLFHHTRMAFGLCNAPATFQRAMYLVLRGLTWREVLAYLDDIMVLGIDFDSHLRNLREVLSRFRQYNLKLKPKKCELFQSAVEFLGKKVTCEGVSVAPAKAKAVAEWPVPKNRTELQSFLGFANYHSDHIQGYAGITAPLYAQSSGKGEIDWGPTEQEAFDRVKQSLANAPVLAYPQKDGLFILDTDASDIAIGAALYQIQDGQEKPINFGSNILQPAQRKYCTTRKELLAVVRFCRYFRHYLLGRKFMVRTDHGSLVWLTRFKNPIGQLARWLEELQEYDMEILHREGRKHRNADGLSRIPDTLEQCDCYHAGVTLESLPCGGCPYCTRAHNQWARFNEDVDDVIPLAVRCLTTDQTQTKTIDSDLEDALTVGFLDSEDENDEIPARDSSRNTSVRVRLVEVAKSQTTQDSGNPAGGSQTEQDTGNPVGGSQIGQDTGNPVGGSQENQKGKEDTGQTKTILQSNWASGFGKEKIREAQLADSDLRPLIDWIESGKEAVTLPGMFAFSPATKSLWLVRDRLCLLDGVLYYVWESEESKTWKLVVPDTLRTEVLKQCHDTCTAGHFGQVKTYFRVKQSFYWYNLSRDCRLYVQGCAVCNKSKKASKKARFSLGDYQAGFPAERVHLDILGPFMESVELNKYILVIVDQFTKWIEIIPISDQTAERIADKLIQCFIQTFGCPLEIHTDQGRNFESNLFKALCELLEIAKTRTTPYRPCSNGQVERYNRVILAYIRSYTPSPTSWDKHLSFLVMALHSIENASTGFTPNELMLGRNVVQPLDLLMGTTDLKVMRKTPNAWLTGLANQLEKVQKFAREKLRGTRRRQKRDYDRRILENQYSIGDLVYRLDFSTKIGAKALQPVWLGPYVVEHCEPPLYWLRGRRRRGVWHHDKLKLCQDRDLPLWLRRLRRKVFNPVEDSDNLGQEEETEDDPISDIAGLLDPPIETVKPKQKALAVGESQNPRTKMPAPAAGGSMVNQTNGETGDALKQQLGTTTRFGRRRKIPAYLADYDVSGD